MEDKAKQKKEKEYLAGWQRCKADFLNYKKDEAKRVEALLIFAKMQWLLQLLPIFDDLERAQKHIPSEDWAKGVLQIKEQVSAWLKEQGVEEIKAKGEKFDPALYEAIEEVEQKDVAAGTIVEVAQKGYLLNGRLLRPAKVKVAK